MLATEQSTETETKPAATVAPLEVHATNAPMRHIPALSWMCDKLDGDLRRRIEKLCASLESHMTAGGENEVRMLCRALDRLADAAKHVRSNGHGPSEASQKVRWSINHALSCLRLVDATTFGRREPFHHFEKSKAEPLYAAFLVVVEHVHRLTEVVRTIDPSIDERLNEGLVQLQEPLREQPIA